MRRVQSVGEKKKRPGQSLGETSICSLEGDRKRLTGC